MLSHVCLSTELCWDAGAKICGPALVVANTPVGVVGPTKRIVILSPYGRLFTHSLNGKHYDPAHICLRSGLQETLLAEFLCWMNLHCFSFPFTLQQLHARLHLQNSVLTHSLLQCFMLSALHAANMWADACKPTNKA